MNEKSRKIFAASCFNKNVNANEIVWGKGEGEGYLDWSFCKNRKMLNCKHFMERLKSFYYNIFEIFVQTNHENYEDT